LLLDGGINGLSGVQQEAITTVPCNEGNWNRTLIMCTDRTGNLKWGLICYIRKTTVEGYQKWKYTSYVATGVSENRHLLANFIPSPTFMNIWTAYLQPSQMMDRPRNNYCSTIYRHAYDIDLTFPIPSSANLYLQQKQE
jgi:hypothetical protein